MPYASARMRQRRQELGIKLQDFAPRIGVSYGHYRNVEYRSKPAAIEVFHRIARELAVPVGDLIGEAPVDPSEAADRRPEEAETGAAAQAAQASQAAQAETSAEEARVRGAA